jgi:hypothetical protein
VQLRGERSKESRSSEIEANCNSYW